MVLIQEGAILSVLHPFSEPSVDRAVDLTVIHSFTFGKQIVERVNKKTVLLDENNSLVLFLQHFNLVVQGSIPTRVKVNNLALFAKLH